MQITALFFLSCVTVIEIYFAQSSRIRRPEIFYSLAALTLFAAFLILGGH
jgi:hypothetical protein